MNYVPALSTVFCSACAAECHFEELHDEHCDLCSVCGDDLETKLAAEDSEELLSDEEIVEALLGDELDGAA